MADGDAAGPAWLVGPPAQAASPEARREQDRPERTVTHGARIMCARRPVRSSPAGIRDGADDVTLGRLLPYTCVSLWLPSNAEGRRPVVRTVRPTQPVAVVTAVSHVGEQRLARSSAS